MSFRKMDYYVKRGDKDNAILIAENTLNGRILLYGNYYLNIAPGEYSEIFKSKREGPGERTQKEYLHSLDFVSTVFNAYISTSKGEYKDFIEKIIFEYYEYFCSETVIDIYKEPELPIYAQILLLIRFYSHFNYLPNEEKIKAVLEKYIDWLMAESNFISDNNHGLFQIQALLHLGIFWPENKDSDKWICYAIEKVNEIAKNVYYKDGTNNEHSLLYFSFNNILYKQIVEFCRHYGILGVEKIAEIIKKAEESLETFAYTDSSLPLIGDGAVTYVKGYNSESGLFPDLGACVIKVGDFHLTFKIKTLFQAHAHVDIASITLRYKDIDLICDSGKINSEVFSPVNRFERASTGHSAILPLSVDGLFLKDLDEYFSETKITEFEISKDYAKTSGVYTYLGTTVKRTIEITNKQVLISDSWGGGEPINLRQRFVLPGEFMDRCRFSVSQKKVDVSLKDFGVEYQVRDESGKSYTVPNIGVRSLKYGEYEPTLLVDTVCENESEGVIEARISILEKDS